MRVFKDQTTVQAEPLRVKAVGAWLLPLQEALKPGGEARLPPGGMVPLYERLVTVTAPPDWLKVPFQAPGWITCPFEKLNFKVQPLIVVEPVLVILMVAVKPVFHWLLTT